ncbi:hypothetical protein AB0J35_24570 [Nonomuraea angiospora]
MTQYHDLDVLRRLRAVQAKDARGRAEALAVQCAVIRARRPRPNKRR